MAAGYDISSAQDQSSRAATGAIRLGDVYIGAQAGGSTGGLSWPVILLAAGAVWFFFFRKKS